METNSNPSGEQFAGTRERRTSGRRSSPLAAVQCSGMNRSENPKSRPRLPKMGRHSSGQARITLNGKVHYLGAFGSPEAHQRYAELVQKWLSGGGRPLTEVPHAGQVLLTVRDLFVRYSEWVMVTGRYLKNGSPTSQRHLIEDVLLSFEAFAGSARVTLLGEPILMQWRDRLEQNQRLTRRGVNRKVALLLSALKWARARGLLPRATWGDCSVIEPLKRGECGSRPERARERRAVSIEDVDRVAAACTCRHVAAMLRFQALVGCRPGEVCALRWMDVDRTPVVVEEVTMWTFRVPQTAAKTAHHGKGIRYPIPPAAQRILEEFPAPPAALVFSPQQSMAERGRARKSAPAFGAGWTNRSYRNAVVAARRKAGVPYFCPHEIRHGAITRAAERHGVLAAQQLANHQSTATTARHLHANDLAAYHVAARIG